MLRSPQNLAFSAVLIIAVYLTWTTLRSYSYASLLKEEWRLQREASEQLAADLTQKNHDLQIALKAQNAQGGTDALPPTIMPVLQPANPGPDLVNDKPVDKPNSGFAYLFYATADPYACSVLVNIYRLQSIFHTVIPIHVLVSSDVGQGFVDAMKAAHATVHVKDPPPVLDFEQDSYYKDCLLKLLAFEMHLIAPGLTRVLIFDSDQLIMKNLDHLFDGLPAVDLAAPRAYWLSKDFISSTFMMINLSDRLWNVFQNALDTRTGGYDMDIVNSLLGDTVLMLGGEYVTINSHWEDWNLPSWFHPISEINMTHVDLVNAATKAQDEPEQDDEELDDDTQDRIVKRQQQHSLFSKPVEGENPSLKPNSAVTSSKEVSSDTSSSAAPSSEPLFPVWERPKPPTPTPRFPLAHPLTVELYRLRDAAAVIHFFAVGKPWRVDSNVVNWDRPDAHPLLGELFEVWRSTAENVCPGGLPPM